MKREKNLSRRAAGMGAMLPFVIWVVLLVAVFGVHVVVKQRMNESRQRMDAMKREMSDIETTLVSLQAQQGAMLTNASLELRLRSRGTSLVKIPARSPVYLPETKSRNEGMAMGSTSVPARR
ncbi:MAG: hypothetical protein ACKO2G_12195 [Verrucomicrobiales bacterium]